MAEHKWAKTHHFDLYCGEKYVKDRTRDTRAEVVGLAHSHFKMKFKEKLGVKYFVPDPINGKVVMKFSDVFLKIYIFSLYGKNHNVLFIDNKNLNACHVLPK